MDDVPIDIAKATLDDLVARARRGEIVRITDGHGVVRLTASHVGGDITAARITDMMPPFVPLAAPRVPNRLAGIIPPPPKDFFEPLTESELALWYGEDA